jgi:hypothetical protein
MLKVMLPFKRGSYCMYLGWNQFGGHNLLHSAGHVTTQSVDCKYVMNAGHGRFAIH